MVTWIPRRNPTRHHLAVAINRLATTPFVGVVPDL